MKSLISEILASDQKWSKQSVLSVVGTTATGKTKLALQLAKELIGRNLFSGVDLISVDSRQVYRDLQVVSGADIPDHFQPVERKGKFDFFEFESIRLHGVAIIGVERSWSLADFQMLALPVIMSALQKNRLPILVGGTGLYHSHLFNQELLFNSQPDPKFRRDLEKLTLSQLQKKLEIIDFEVWQSMNESDRANRRRLIRKIELADNHRLRKEASSLSPAKRKLLAWLQSHQLKSERLGLKLPLTRLEEKIKHRVHDRFSGGAITEVKNLLERSLVSPSPAFSTLGVAEIKAYLSKQITAHECQEIWALKELQYAKRQLTWWKKDQSVKWVSIS